MERRPITETGLKISAVGLGCVTFGREIDQDTSFGLLDHAIGKGINLLDTAESYGGGQTKTLREQQFGIRDDREGLLAAGRVWAMRGKAREILDRVVKFRAQSRYVHVNMITHTPSVDPCIKLVGAADCVIERQDLVGR